MGICCLALTWQDLCHREGRTCSCCENLYQSGIDADGSQSRGAGQSGGGEVEGRSTWTSQEEKECSQ